MFQSVSIRNFQSLKSLDLELGPLTVVVGDSSSGKTALIRALRMLVNNERGSWFVTNGESDASVSVRDNKCVVSLSKGVGNSGEYRIGHDLTEQRFTKLAGSVPAEVSEALGVYPGGPNFAFQFDAPFLLKESGTSVAVTLGSLTGVSRIFEAVREANRKRLAASSLVKTRTTDLELIQERLEKFGDLEGRGSLLAQAEAAWEKSQDLGYKAQGLQGLLETLAKCKRDLAAVVVPEIPDFSETENILHRRKLLRSLLDSINVAMMNISDLTSAQTKATSDYENAEAEYRQELERAGRCPTCQQEIASGRS